MLGTIMNLFGRSPFAALQTHMEKVRGCVHLLPDLFAAVDKGDNAAVHVIAAKISELENQADLTRNDIRTHLPKSLFLPIDRTQLLEILSTQDKIANKAEDIATLATIKPLQLLPVFRNEFLDCLKQNIDTFDAARRVIKEMHDLLESSFGGAEAEKVRAMVEEVAFKEHEVDLIQKKLLIKIFSAENEIPYTTFFLWQKIFDALAAISNMSETLAYRVRVTLDVK